MANKNLEKNNPTRQLREDEIKTRAKVFSHLSATVLVILFVLAISQTELHGLRGVLIDALFRTQWWTTPHSQVALVGYDDDSAARYDGANKLPAEEIAQVFDLLAEDKPLAVGILAAVNDKVYTETELAILAKSFAKVPNTFIGYTDDESLGKNAPQALLHTARYMPGFVSRDTFSYGADSVTRRVMINIEGIPTVFTKLAAIFHNVSITAPASSHLHRFERFGESAQTYINWQGPSGTYTIHPTSHVALHRIAKGTFTNKVVLISTVLHSKKGEDHVFTPFSRAHFDTTRLEAAANSLVTLMRDDGILRTSPLVNFLFTLLVGIITVNMVLFLPPGRGIFFVIAEIVLLLSGSWAALFGLGYWVNIAHSLVIACVSYYLVIPYRLVDEYRKRWHYQEKSELMAQLEQLKSNFLSLVSHDLKTPLARIQGNAELALSGGGGSGEAAKRSLDAIIHTTEDLSQYVETVLDITRIESSKMPLQKASKDINAIVREVVEKKRVLAEEKNIDIKTALEPLFSIKFDVKLIKQVIANLVENAIKYSPPGTTITVSSKEDNDFVRVSVADEGPGIAPDEQEKIFGKFYRVKNQETDQVKGSGLGLYLVKYFAELHGGTVELTSEVGRGSTFTVSLPV
jgi:signal transduction histidine kinase